VTGHILPWKLLHKNLEIDGAWSGICGIRSLESGVKLPFLTKLLKLKRRLVQEKF